MQNGVKLQPSGFKGSALLSLLLSLLSPSLSAHFAPAAARSDSDKSQKASFRPERKQRSGGGDELNKGQILQIRAGLRNSSSGFSSTGFRVSAPKAA